MGTSSKRTIDIVKKLLSKHQDNLDQSIISTGTEIVNNIPQFITPKKQRKFFDSESLVVAVGIGVKVAQAIQTGKFSSDYNTEIPTELSPVTLETILHSILSIESEFENLDSILQISIRQAITKTLVNDIEGDNKIVVFLTAFCISLIFNLVSELSVEAIVEKFGDIPNDDIMTKIKSFAESYVHANLTEDIMQCASGVPHNISNLITKIMKEHAKPSEG